MPNPSLRILHLIPTLKQGGAERLVLDIVRELGSREGVEVQLAVLRTENDYPEQSKGLPIVHCPARVVPSLTGQPTVALEPFRQLMATFRPQVVHSHLFEAELVSRWEPQAGIRYFSHAHDNMAQLALLSWGTLGSKRRLTDYYERSLLLRRYRVVGNHFLAISPHTEAYLRQSLPASNQLAISLFPNAIRYAAFAAPARTAAPGTPLRVVMAGSLVPKKHQALLVEIAACLHRQGIEAEWEIAGEGPERARLTAQIGQYGLQDRVRLLGKVADISRCYQQADLYVHTALYEPFGLVLLEAMSAGLPVVALDGGGNRELIEEGRNGFLIPRPVPALFAEKITYLLAHPEAYRSMSQYAQQFAQRYDIGPYVDRLLELYCQEG